MERISFHDRIAANKRNSVFLMVLILAFALFIGWLIGQIYDPTISIFFITIAAIIAIAQIYYSYNYGDQVVLKITKARPINEQNVKEKHLLNVVEGLALAAGIPTPKVYVIDSNEMNAFATGKDPDHASIAVTSALLNKLNRAELEGVIGHEISHICNYDIRFATLIAVAVGFVAIIGYMFSRSLWLSSDRRERGNAGILLLIGLLFAVVAPIAVKLIQLAISRQREYLADASSAKLTRYPEGLASALEKIANENKFNMDVPEAVSHLFFVSPTKNLLESLYSTHPPIEKRIQILRSM